MGSAVEVILPLRSSPHAMVVEQSLLVKTECVQIFPRQLVLIKLILPGQFGDTSLVVEFAVFYQFLAVRSGGFPPSESG